jgi:opacity protein-like surface antigen
MQNPIHKQRTGAVLAALCFFLCLLSVRAQNAERQTHFNYFGHLEYELDLFQDATNSYFSLGEQDFFVTSKLSKRISFLGETVVRYDSKSPSYFIPSIERMQIKFDYFKNHSLVVGKIHTPVNYWNDTYHHGRIFFPTIDRPYAFTYLVPIHTLGLRLQGQNLGALRFGYDIVSGNGISSTDFTNPGLNSSFLAGVHFKPVDNLRIGVSYYYDFIENNFSGVHSGHAGSAHSVPATTFKGNVDFELFSASISYFGNKFEVLNEFALNKTRTDTLGIALNYSNFIYLGYRIKDKFTPLVAFDFVEIAEKELHVTRTAKNKMVLGFKYEFSPMMNLKFHAERYSTHALFHPSHWHVASPDYYEFKIQLAYGF